MGRAAPRRRRGRCEAQGERARIPPGPDRASPATATPRPPGSAARPRGSPSLLPSRPRPTMHRAARLTWRPGRTEPLASGPPAAGAGHGGGAAPAPLAPQPGTGLQRPGGAPPGFVGLPRGVGVAGRALPSSSERGGGRRARGGCLRRRPPPRPAAPQLRPAPALLPASRLGGPSRPPDPAPGQGGGAGAAPHPRPGAPVVARRGGRWRGSGPKVSGEPVPAPRPHPGGRAEGSARLRARRGLPGRSWVRAACCSHVLWN